MGTTPQVGSESRNTASCQCHVMILYIHVMSMSFLFEKKNDEKWIIFDLSLCAILLLYGKRKSYGNDSTHTF